MTYVANSSCCADHCSLWAWNIAAMRSSSVMALFNFIELLVLADCLTPAFDADCSFREEFFAFTGIFPDMYRAARPAPAFNGGNRRAMMDVDRGIMVVSSSYSGRLLVAGKFKWPHA